MRKTCTKGLYSSPMQKKQSEFHKNTEMLSRLSPQIDWKALCTARIAKNCGIRNCQIVARTVGKKKPRRCYLCEDLKVTEKPFNCLIWLFSGAEGESIRMTWMTRPSVTSTKALTWRDPFPWLPMHRWMSCLRWFTSYPIPSTPPLSTLTTLGVQPVLLPVLAQEEPTQLTRFSTKSSTTAKSIT